MKNRDGLESFWIKLNLSCGLKACLEIRWWGGQWSRLVERRPGGQGRGVSASARFIAGQVSWQAWLEWGVRVGEGAECPVKFRQWQ